MDCWTGTKTALHLAQRSCTRSRLDRLVAELARCSVRPLPLADSQRPASPCRCRNVGVTFNAVRSGVAQPAVAVATTRLVTAPRCHLPVSPPPLETKKCSCMGAARLYRAQVSDGAMVRFNRRRPIYMAPPYLINGHRFFLYVLAHTLIFLYIFVLAKHV